MYLLLCQLFSCITGHNLPEEVFDVMFYLLQGKRSGRGDIGRDIKDFGKQSPHQILLTDIPTHLYQTYERCHHFNKAMFSRDFRELLYRHPYLEEEIFKPVWMSQTIWIDKTYDKPIVRMNLVLDMETESQKQIVLRNMKCIRQTYSGYRLNWLPKCRALDISWMSSCVFCGEFMRFRSNKLRKQKSDIEKICEKINRLDYNYVDEFYNLGEIKRVPICSQCESSKERQGKYRMNMLSRGDWGDSFYHERDYLYHRSIGNLYILPDTSNIPVDIKCSFETPLDYSMMYWNLTDPLSDYFWHPDMSADEYMRYMEWKFNVNIDELEPLDDDLWDQFEEIPEAVVEDVMEGIIQELE